jgi:hypothetical protein
MRSREVIGRAGQIDKSCNHLRTNIKIIVDSTSPDVTIS